MRPTSPAVALSPRRHDAPVVVVLGRRGSGKTTLVKSRLDAFSRVLIVDPEHEYTGETYTDLGALWADVRGASTFRAVYRPTRGVVSDVEIAAVDILAQIALEVGNVLLVIDEADRYVVAGKNLSPYLRLCVDQGRHRGVGICAIARRPARLSKDLIENASALFLFHTHGAHSRAYLADIIEGDAADLSKLRTGEYLAWDERAGVRRGGVELVRAVSRLRSAP